MIPLKLSMENFFSHKNSEIDFSLFNSALLIGNTEGDYTKSNGSGKSAIFEGMLWCLFNRSRVAMMDDVIRWGEKTCKVSLEFLHDEKTYRVIRTRNRMSSTSNVELKVLDSFEEWKDISGSVSGDTNRKIEQTIKLDYKTFINSVYFRQNDISEFAEADASKKKEILKSIVDISRWDEYEKASKSKAKELNAECKALQVVLEDFDATVESISGSESDMNTLSEELKDLRLKKDSALKSLAEIKENYQLIKQSLDTSAYDRVMLEIDEIKKEGSAKQELGRRELKNIEDVELKLSAENSKLSRLSTDGLEAVDVPDGIVEELTSQVTYHNSNLIALKLELEKTRKHKEISTDGVCPTCNQDLSSDAHKDFLAKQEEYLLDLKRKIQHHKAEYDSITSQINSWNSIISNNSRLEKILAEKSNVNYRISLLLSEKNKYILSYDETSRSISNLKDRLRQSKEILNSIKNEDFQNLREKIKEKEKEIESLDDDISKKDKMFGRLQERVSVLNEKLEKMKLSKKLLDEKLVKISVFDRLTKLLGKSGIQTVLLDTIIEDLEKTSNVILQSICNEPAIIVLETQRVGSDGSSTVETLDLKVKKDGNLQNFKSLSGGEKFRISLALRVAMSDISSRYGGSCLEFLLLDEVNSPLDRYGVETLFVNVIKSLEDKYKILTITHDENLKEKFENVINVTKINGESEIEFLTR